MWWESFHVKVEGADSQNQLDNGNPLNRAEINTLCSNNTDGTNDTEVARSESSGTKSIVLKRKAEFDQTGINSFDFRFKNLMKDNANVVKPLNVYGDATPETNYFRKTNFYDYNNKFSIIPNRFEEVCCIDNNGKPRSPIGAFRSFQRFERNKDRHQHPQKASPSINASTCIYPFDNSNYLKENFSLDGRMKREEDPKVVNKDMSDELYTYFVHNFGKIFPNVSNDTKSHLKEEDWKELRKLKLKQLRQQHAGQFTNVNGSEKYISMPKINVSNLYNFFMEDLSGTKHNKALTKDESTILSHLTKEESLLTKDNKTVEDFILQSVLNNDKASKNKPCNKNNLKKNKFIVKNTAKNNTQIGLRKIVSIRHPEILKHLHKIDMSILSYPPAFNYGSSDLLPGKPKPPGIVTIRTNPKRRSVNRKVKTNRNSTGEQTRARHLKLMKLNKARRLPIYNFQRQSDNNKEVNPPSCDELRERKQNIAHRPIHKKTFKDANKLSREDEIAICTAKEIELQIVDSENEELNERPFFVERVKSANSHAMVHSTMKYHRVPLSRNWNLPEENVAEIVGKFNYKHKHHPKFIINKKNEQT